MNLFKKQSFAFRTTILFFLYTLGLVVSLWLAYQFRFEFNVRPQYTVHIGLIFLWVVTLKLILLYAFRQFDGLLSYFSVPDLLRIFYAMGVASVVMYVVLRLTNTEYAAPRGVILSDFNLSFTGLAAARLCLRLLRERYFSPTSGTPAQIRRVGIVGAGDAGANLARELSSKRGLGLSPAIFFDDDPDKWSSRVHDIQVVGAPEMLLDPRFEFKLDEVIIAMPSAPARRIGEIVKLLQKCRLKFETVPSLDQLATGQLKVSQLRPVEIQDLLGREPVKLDTQNIATILKGRVVMVTGAGGSIGSELCRQIASFNPRLLLLVEQSEVQAFQIEQELIGLGHARIIHPIIADILDLPRVRYLMDRFQPEVVFNAAAHKHVPMMESQPSEAVKNNTVGTAQLAELALEFGVDRFVQISTDKAINPTNVMGATKRMAEMFLQALHAKNPGRTKFMNVRFGNVLGSSGSVVPTFNKQIATGGPVKVTHPDVTRYFMTIPEAAGLVLQSAAQGLGGEIFVLDMGQPIKIVDLARQLIELSGLKPDEDIAIEFVGLRPGEKLYEELSHKGENITPTHHPKILRFVTEPLALEEVRRRLNELTQNINNAEPNELKLLLKKAVPEYQPFVT